MKKLAIRLDPGYTQMSNHIADDDALAVVDMGMLLKLHRCVDGYDVTVQSIADRHSDPARRGTGYTALEASMRNVVQRGYVVKIKYQDEGGHWRTVFAPFHQPATPAHVAAMLDAIEEPVTAYRVEPQWLDTRENTDTKPDLRKRPSTGSGSTDSALSGSRSAGSRPEASSIRTEHAPHQTNDHTNRPSRPSPTRAHANAATGTEGPEGPKPAKSRKAVSRPQAAPSAGVTLLVEIGREMPALAFSGPWLTAQGKRLDALLDAGWTAAQLHTLLTAALPDIVERPAGLIRRRIDDIPTAPTMLPLGRVPEQRDSEPNPAAPWDGPRLSLDPQQWQTPSSTKAADRTVTEAVGRRATHECDGRDGQCGRPVPTPGALCPACRGDGAR